MTWQGQFRQAVSLHQAGRLAEAERLYGQLLAADPRNFPAQYQLAFLLYQQQRQPEALRAVEAALTLQPDDLDALVLRGGLLLSAGQLEEALRSFDRALAANPAFAGALYYRGTTLIDLGRYPEAVAAFDAAVVQAPDLVEAWSNRGLALFEMKNYAESLRSYDRAVALRPDDARAWANRGKALNNLARFDDALASYDRAIALAPEYGQAWYARALTLRTLHRFDEALACADRALTADPQSSPLRFLRGQLMCELNRIGAGIGVLREAAERDLRTNPVAPGPAHKQRHDAEQRAYLAAQGVPLREGDIHFAGGGRLDGPAVTPGNAPAAAAQWEGTRPRIAVIDNFLTAQALENLRAFCRGSTVWRTAYGGGYLGAMPEQGFACPLLAQIAEELRDCFPPIIGDHRLRMLWGFKYDSRLKGIGIHADQAAVNVNFWITPDDANRDPERGGMQIWDVAAPADWDIAKYNGDEAAVRAFLDQAGAKPVTVPYRANRAVIFDSDLFHETDAIDFEEGYLNRRINITMLYGRRTYYGN